MNSGSEPEFVPRAWLDPRLEIRDSPIHGRGTFARAAIAAGELVTGWPHRIVDGRIWVPPDDRTAPEAFLNHSCDPHIWMTDEVTLVACRAIAPAEELTTDYALFELDRQWTARWRCRCGSPRCRGTVTGRDYELRELQERYGNHFHPDLLRRK